jgi:hypothetical protein
MDKYLADAKIWAESEQGKYAKATAAAFATVDDATEAFVDHSNIEEQSKEWIHLETLKRTLNAYGVEIGSRLHGGDITINTKTAPCVANHPHGRARGVMQKRLRDAFVLKVSLFRELVQAALETITWYDNDAMPTHCWLVQDLDAYKDSPELMAEEITLIIMNEGVLTLNPNKDWSAECPDGIYFPIAITTGMFNVPISRTQALRWLENKEWGADLKVSVSPKSHVLGRHDIEMLEVRELGTHASHYSKKEWGNTCYMSTAMAVRLASYSAAQLDDQHVVNEPFLRAFQQGSASRTAQQLQVSRLARENLLLYALDLAPKDSHDYYMDVLLARKIIQKPEICDDEGVKSIVKLTASLPVCDYVMRGWGDVPLGRFLLIWTVGPHP